MMQYELRTIKDIFDRVPIDRVDTLFKELRVLMEQAAFVRGVAEISEGAVLFPDCITWLDDGKGEVVASFGADCSNKDFLTIKATLARATGTGDKA